MKNQTIPALALMLIIMLGNTGLKCHANSVYSMELQLKKDSVSTLLPAVYATNMKQLELSGLAVKRGGKLKKLAENLRDYFIKSNTELQRFAVQEKITMPMTKPQGGMRPDGRVDSAPENMKDTTRNEPGTGEAGNNGKTAPAIKKPDAVPPVLKLSKLSGADFNDAYTQAVKEDLNHLVALYNKMVQSDNKYQTFAKEQLNHLNYFLGKLK